jgi:hypothetical protein
MRVPLVINFQRRRTNNVDYDTVQGFKNLNTECAYGGPRDL